MDQFGGLIEFFDGGMLTNLRKRAGMMVLEKLFDLLDQWRLRSERGASDDERFGGLRRQGIKQILLDRRRPVVDSLEAIRLVQARERIEG